MSSQTSGICEYLFNFFESFLSFHRNIVNNEHNIHVIFWKVSEESFIPSTWDILCFILLCLPNPFSVPWVYSHWLHLKFKGYSSSALWAGFTAGSPTSTVTAALLSSTSTVSLMIVGVEASSALVSSALAALPAARLSKAVWQVSSDAAPHGAAGKVISSSWEQKKQEKEDEGEKEVGNVDDLCDLTQQTASCEDFRLYKPALAWLCLPASNVLQLPKTGNSHIKIQHDCWLWRMQ